MTELKDRLVKAERIDLAAAVGRDPDALSLFARMDGLAVGNCSLLERTQAVMDAVLDDPPPAAPGGGDSTVAPWWSPMPAAYAAALFQHVGLLEVGTSGEGRMPPHGRQSARLAREEMRRWGVPFAVREHAVELVADQRKAEGLPRSGAPAETYMRLSCALDLRALYFLRRAEHRAVGGAADEPRLEAFRRRAEELGVFGKACPPPLGRGAVRRLGFADERQAHRALNALRYFRLVARMNEGEWYGERLRQEMRRRVGRLHLLVGPAGSGKSTWAREHLAGTTIVSADRMREELTGDPADQSQNYLVFQRCMDRVREELRLGRDVTFDATNYSEALRSTPVQAGRWAGAEITSYFFDVALERALEWNLNRRRAVPESVIRKHYRLLEPPALYEADRHVVVDTEGAAAPYWPLEGEGKMR